MMNKEKELQRYIGQLFSESLKISSPIQMLHIIREKMNTRGYQSFDKADWPALGLQLYFSGLLFHVEKIFSGMPLFKSASKLLYQTQTTKP